MQGFLRTPDERTKKKVVLCPFPRPELGWDWTQGLEGVKVVVSGDPILPSGYQSYGSCVPGILCSLCQH